MAITKKTKTSGKKAEVTFKINEKHNPSEADVFVLGDFNNWQMADPDFQLEKKRGNYTKTVELEIGQKYEFRYVNRDFMWFNDESADAYVPSPFYGIDNCVVDLTTVKKTKVAPKKASVAKAKTAKKIVKDDLRKIEGIGPKIAGILGDNGIHTFNDLGKAKVAQLKKILREAGPRYTMHKPGTWPKQAKLAAAGKWEQLKTLQDKLDGGK
ncbi:Glycoside hydrolase family 13 domain protein [Croceitalea dokdonensis DOKDO 023]|uniref:Glycoside hydrolase family 13 domain protein n=1 Tax=Croceitalea dokdonensis DOKDO 023 TaxID=1300341 RepID=A0A0P7B1A8_9FLAO|nr:helix-hairpin-helix domain-containing protein [Croceitalea dokdonensis]KPM32798.1 Glycoside hydrolase family 13 domain protein [Croceitalea dokdonensis DOKDO 023]